MTEKEKQVKKILDGLNKKYGDNTVVYGDNYNSNLGFISTGSLKLDKICNGGFPRGRITELYGGEHSGKTLRALEAIAKAQKQGLTCAFIDAENRLNKTHAERLGVDFNKLIISQMSVAEDSFKIIKDLIETGFVDLIVLDSLASLCPRAEVEGEIGDALVGVMGRVTGQSVRKINPLLNNTKTALVIINQVRDTMDKYHPTITPGGKALKFFASLRIEVRSNAGGRIKDSKGTVIGITTKAKLTKSSISMPFVETDSVALFTDEVYGTDIIQEIIDLALGGGVSGIEKRGAWIYLDEGIFKRSADELKFQGKDAFLTFLKNSDNADIFEIIEKQVLADNKHSEADEGSFTDVINNAPVKNVKN